MTPKRGFFLTIEGIEGAGKSTLAEALSERLSSEGKEVVLTREPGGTRIGDSIRKLLLESGTAMSSRAELLLFEAARAQHVEELIKPALERGAVVVCDRFADSSVAYQGSARGIEPQAIACLNEFATGGLRPDLTILLDLPADVGLARQMAIDRISAEGLAFHESVRQGYLAIARAEPERIATIDAAQSFEDVLRQAWGVVDTARSEGGL
jgi:dTMP kinase